MTKQSVHKGGLKRYFLLHSSSYISPHILQVHYTTSSFYDVLLPCLKIEVAPQYLGRLIRFEMGNIFFLMVVTFPSLFSLL